MSTIVPLAKRLASSQDFSRFSAPKFIQSFKDIAAVGSAVAVPREGLPFPAPFLAAGMESDMDNIIHSRKMVRHREADMIMIRYDLQFC